MSTSWRHTVGDMVYSLLTGKKMMVLDLISMPLDTISQYGYKLRTPDFQELFLYDLEVTEREPQGKKEKSKDKEEPKKEPDNG